MIAALAIVAIAMMVVCAIGIPMLSQSGGSEEYVDNSAYHDFSDNDVLDWNYWLGNTDSAGVSDAKTPIFSSDIQELWSITGYADSSSVNWKTPGSAICVGSYTYYYNAGDSSLRCVDTSTGTIVKSTTCVSDSVYNMAIAHGDGKIFVPCKEGSYTIMKVYDAESLDQLYTCEPVLGGEVQGSVTYNDGYVYFGTYGGDFACFSSYDVNTSSSDEKVSATWILDENGWYNATPAFAGNYCMVASGGYSDGGATIYVLDSKTGAIYDTYKMSSEYVASGLTMYNGRVYVATNYAEVESATTEVNTDKTLKIHSFTVNADGTLDTDSENIWVSAIENGGTQSTPVIWNNRLYIGGGGSTMGTNEPLTVINIADNGTMTTAYTFKTTDGSGLCTKSTASITIGYASASNNYAVYIYVIEYGQISSNDSTGLSGSADIYVLKDSEGQTSPEIVFNFTPSVKQFAYQSFTISSEGYILIRNDSTLFCYGHMDTVASVYTFEDVQNEIARIMAFSDDGYVSYAEVTMAESRYSALSEEDKSEVINYSDLQELYCIVTLITEGSENTELKVLKNSCIDFPQFSNPSGKIFSGWYTSSGMLWNICSSKVTGDIILTAYYDQSFEVTLDANGGSGSTSMDVAKNGVMGYVSEPTRSGYTFAGWFSGDAEYIPCKSTISSDITLKAKWLADYKISFDSDGGSSAESVRVVYSMTIGDLPTVKKSGYSFEGWYLDGTEITSDMEYEFTENITVKAKWTQNTGNTLDNGNGISVTASIPSDSVLYVNKASSVSSSVKAIASYAKTDVDCILIKVLGDGVTGELDFTVSIIVGTSQNGNTLTAYYYTVDDGVETTSGTVSGGVLTVTVKGDTSSSGVDIVLGLVSGTEMNSHV